MHPTITADAPAVHWMDGFRRGCARVARSRPCSVDRHRSRACSACVRACVRARRPSPRLDRRPVLDRRPRQVRQVTTGQVVRWSGAQVVVGINPITRTIDHYRFRGTALGRGDWVRDIHIYCIPIYPSYTHIPPKRPHDSVPRTSTSRTRALDRGPTSIGDDRWSIDVDVDRSWSSIDGGRRRSIAVVVIGDDAIAAPQLATRRARRRRPPWTSARRRDRGYMTTTTTMTEGGRGRGGRRRGAVRLGAEMDDDDGASARHAAACGGVERRRGRRRWVMTMTRSRKHKIRYALCVCVRACARVVMDEAKDEDDEGFEYSQWGELNGAGDSCMHAFIQFAGWGMCVAYDGCVVRMAGV